MSRSVTALGVSCLLLTAWARAQEVVPPRPISQPAPAWPEGHAGEHDLLVPVLLTIGTDGSVEKAEVEASVGPAFDEEALRAARSWRFEPARTATGPVRTKVRALVRFLGRPPAPAPPKPVSTPPAKATSPGEVERSMVLVEDARPPRSASEAERRQRLLSVAPHRTASDMIQTVPGLFVTQHSGDGKAHQIFFRGFDAVHGQDLEIWVAGAPVNDVSNIHGQGYADLHFVMPEAVKRLKAQGGPFDPRQGDFAVAGSVDLELGLAEWGQQIEVGAGSFGARRVFLGYRPEGEPEATFAAAELYSSEGFGPGRAARRASVLGQVLHPLGDALRLRVMASTYAGRFGSAGVLRLEDIEAGRLGPLDSYDTRQGGHSARSQLVCEIVSETRSAHVTVEPYVVLRSLGLRQNYTGYLNDPVNGDGSQQTHDATTVGARASMRQPFHLISANDSVELGVFGRHDSIEQSHRRTSGVNGSVVETLVAARIVAVDAGGYLDFSVRPWRRLVLRGGARLDGLSYAVKNDAETSGTTRSAHGAHLGKKLGLDHAFAPGLHGLVSYGEGFRSPQARSLGDGERTPFVTVRSVEAGLRGAHARELTWSVAAFRTVLSEDLVFDEQTARNEPGPGTERLGVVADVTSEIGNLLTAAVGASFTRAVFTASAGRYQAGTLVPYVPQVVVRTDLGVRVPLHTLSGHSLVGSAGMGTSALYRRPLPYGELGHDIWLVDARAALRWQAVELEASATNLLDRRWYDGEFVYASAFRQSGAPSQVPARHVTVGAPRTLLASVCVRF